LSAEFHTSTVTDQMHAALNVSQLVILFQAQQYKRNLFLEFLAYPMCNWYLTCREFERACDCCQMMMCLKY